MAYFPRFWAKESPPHSENTSDEKWYINFIVAHVSHPKKWWKSDDYGSRNPVTIYNVFLFSAGNCQLYPDTTSHTTHATAQVQPFLFALLRLPFFFFVGVLYLFLTLPPKNWFREIWKRNLYEKSRVLLLQVQNEKKKKKNARKKKKTFQRYWGKESKDTEIILAKKC